ncbi:hypothetical protein [Mucilaginibacter antarcticus]|uniref:Uncharacterized protein n=1 Tax=Mucilaginibacter antarcticus TaxID=1855725 RepID=A0ABW5XUS3_9SPHI
MIKRLAYIILLLIFATDLSSAKIRIDSRDLVNGNAVAGFFVTQLQKDTTKKHSADEDQKKIKEISKAKKQAKPERISGTDVVQDPKAKPKARQRRPEGLDRPPEIPRRNGN